ncbi:DUF4062 domain-containing protein [Pseudomonas graminis]|uniref:DUF4062 domain-containing protein n=1 Tax=Pseudomonas graminis TaxID=158627 RepID=UPI00105D3826|nr:DUF4062 domain-containing protein [Pseudomonas graminis]
MKLCGGLFVKVFISSVVRGFEAYRASARKAVGLLQHQTIMCEDFGARPDSSEVACMTEVDQADVVIVILGADFGFKTPSGESVTQQEFRRARAGGKRVLAFLQDVPVEGPQEAFRWEVSDYVDGLFRATFCNEHELSDAIVQALHQLNVTRAAISEHEFVERLQQHQGHGQRHWNNWSRDTRIEIAFLPQPELSGTLRQVHSEHETFFLKLCQAGLSSVKDGYKDFDQGDLTGIDAGTVAWRHHDSGMAWFTAALTAPTSNHDPFAGHYISPSRVRKLAEAAFGLITHGRGGWFQLSLTDISYKLFQEPPTVVSSSLSMPHRQEEHIVERQLLIPASQAAYNRWLDEVFFRMGRKLTG